MLLMICSTLLKPRCRIAWDPCYKPIASLGFAPTDVLTTVTSLPTSTQEFPRICNLVPGADTPPSLQGQHGNEGNIMDGKMPTSLFTIDTSFNFDSPANKSLEGKFKRGDKRSIQRYTTKQRKRAEKAIKTSSLQDIKTKVNQLKSYNTWRITVFLFKACFSAKNRSESIGLRFC